MRVILAFDPGLEPMLEKTWYSLSARVSTVQDLTTDISQFFSLDNIRLTKAGKPLDLAAFCLEVLQESDELQVARNERVVGTRTLFLSDGSVEVRPVEPWFYMLSPAEEYELKRKQWKIKPIPKRKPF